MTGRAIRTLLCMGLVVGASTAVAQGAGPITLPCRMPEGTPLRFTLEQRLFTPDGTPITVSIARAVVFGRDAAGLFLDSAPPQVTTSDTGARAQRFADFYAATGAEPMRLRLDATGGLVGIADEERHWKAFLDGQRGIVARAGAGGSVARDRAAKAYQALASATPARRRAILAGFAEPFMRHCGQVLGEPFDHAGALVVRREERSGGDGGIAEQTIYSIDRETGLTMRIERTVTPHADPSRPLVERWSLTAGNGPENL